MGNGCLVPWLAGTQSGLWQHYFASRPVVTCCPEYSSGRLQGRGSPSSAIPPACTSTLWKWPAVWYLPGGGKKRAGSRTFNETLKKQNETLFKKKQKYPRWTIHKHIYSINHQYHIHTQNGSQMLGRINHHPLSINGKNVWLLWIWGVVWVKGPLQKREGRRLALARQAPKKILINNGERQL